MTAEQLTRKLRLWRPVLAAVHGTPCSILETNEIHELVEDAERAADEIERLRRREVELMGMIDQRDRALGFTDQWTPEEIARHTAHSPEPMELPTIPPFKP